MSRLPAGLSRGRALVVAVVLLVLLLVLVVALAWRGSRASDFERVVGLAPEGTARMTYVDWSALRAELDSGLSPSSTTDELAEFLGLGFERDLTMPSALLGSATALHERFRLSPAVLEWESLAQSPDGAVITMRVDPSYDLGALGDRLERIGYTRPSDGEGVWRGGPEMLSRNAVAVTPLLQHLMVLHDEGLVLGSDDPNYLPVAREAVRGSRSLEPEAVVDRAGVPLSALYFVGGFGCSTLAMSQADSNDEQVAESLVREAGKVNPYSGLLVSAQPGGDLWVSFGFENDGQARTNATTRARLAEGQSPGQGGSFGDRFSVASATAQGPVVTLELTPHSPAGYVFSDITSGPVLFATC